MSTAYDQRLMEIKKRLTAVSAKLAESRDAAEEGLKAVAAIRLYIDESEAKRFEALANAETKPTR